MNYELPPGLRHYGADLEAAIGRELDRRPDRRLGSPGFAVRVTTATLTVAVVVAAAILLTVGGSGSGIVTPAYAAFTGNGTAPFIETATRDPGLPPETVTSSVSFSWTSTRLTMTERGTTRAGRRATVQQRVLSGTPVTSLKTGQVTGFPDSGATPHRPGLWYSGGYEAINGRTFDVSVGTTTDASAQRATIRLFIPLVTSTISGSRRTPTSRSMYIETNSSGKTQTFKISNYARYRWHKISTSG
jgi:hypothetical protein